MDKAELLNGMQREYQGWQALLDEIGIEHMEEPGVGGEWSIKDIVAHLTGWRRRTVVRFRALAHGETDPPPPWSLDLKTDDEVNAWMYESRRDWSVRAVLDESDEVFQELVKAIAALPDGALENAAQVPWMEGQAPDAAGLFGHFHEEHEADMRAWLARRGESALTRPQGYLALPSEGKGPGVLVLHAWWGLNDTIKALCNRLAESGYVAFAPDLYHGKVADTIAGAEQLAGALNADEAQAKAGIARAVQFLAGHSSQADRLAVVGLSLGAYYALELASADPEHVRFVVLFYGTGNTEAGSSRASYLGHFAENDPYESNDYVDALEQALERAGRPVTFYRYSGTGHWFLEPDRTDAYNPEAARLAWDRTLAFLQKSLEPDQS